MNKVYRNLMLQRYEFFVQNRKALLSERFNRILTRVTGTVITPMIAISASFVSVSALILGVGLMLGTTSLLVFVLLFVAYALSSKIITPYLRLALRQKIRYSRRLKLIFSESMRSIRDVQFILLMNILLVDSPALGFLQSGMIGFQFVAYGSKICHRTCRYHHFIFGRTRPCDCLW